MEPVSIVAAAIAYAAIKGSDGFMTEAGKAAWDMTSRVVSRLREDRPTAEALDLFQGDTNNRDVTLVLTDAIDHQMARDHNLSTLVDHLIKQVLGADELKGPVGQQASRIERLLQAKKLAEAPAVPASTDSYRVFSEVPMTIEAIVSHLTRIAGEDDLGGTLAMSTRTADQLDHAIQSIAGALGEIETHSLREAIGLLLSAKESVEQAQALIHGAREKIQETAQRFLA